MASISPTQEQVQTAVRSFLLDILPEGWDVIEALDNRVPEPEGTQFVVMNISRTGRLRTNIDSSADVKFTGSITDDVMTVTAVAHGSIVIGARVFGVGVAAGTKVVEQLSGPAGGAGDYTIDPEQTLTSLTLSAGQIEIEEGAEFTAQLDFHGDTIAAGDAARIVTTVFRDAYAAEFFADQTAPLNEIAPLYADDARQAPFFNETMQAEWRWVVEAMLQVNQTVSVPQQYADDITLDLVSVDAAFPP